MKFNKSAESEKWCVEDDDGTYSGKIYKDYHLMICSFEPPAHKTFTSFRMREITNFMDSIEKQSGIDTTSTFKSNSELT